MNRSERRAAEIQARADAIRKAQFVQTMKNAKEARLAERLYLDRGVKLVSLPDERARRMAQVAVQRLQSKREGRVS